jgi:hypothetical protein
VTWQQVPWWSGPCPLEYADVPANAFPKLKWIACPNDEAGCERVERNWPQLSVTAIGDPVVRRDMDGYTLGLFVQLPEFEMRQPVIGPDGVATMVYRTPPNQGACITTELGLASDGHWIGVQMIGEGSVHVFQPDGAPPSQAHVSSLTSPSQRQTGGQNLYATQYDFGVGVELYDRVSQQKTITPSPGDFGGTVPAFTDDAAFLLVLPAFNEPDGWVWTRQRGVFEPLLVRDPKHVLDVRGDGEHLVWIESPAPRGSGDWPAGELYTSPYTTVQGDVVPTLRRLTPAVGPAPGAAIGGGYYVYHSAYTGLIYVVRLSDARQWTMTAPVDEHRAALSDITYVDDTYLYFRTQTEIYRQRLDALGPGEPAN